jgi:hypothetical protein
MASHSYRDMHECTPSTSWPAFAPPMTPASASPLKPLFQRCIKANAGTWMSTMLETKHNNPYIRFSTYKCILIPVELVGVVDSFSGKDY